MCPTCRVFPVSQLANKHMCMDLERKQTLKGIYLSLSFDYRVSFESIKENGEKR